MSISIKAQATVTNIPVITTTTTTTPVKVEKVSIRDVHGLSRREMEGLATSVGLEKIKAGKGAAKTGSHAKFASGGTRVSIAKHTGADRTGMKGTRKLVQAINTQLTKRAQENKSSVQPDIEERKVQITVGGRKKTVTKSVINIDNI